VVSASVNLVLRPLSRLRAGVARIAGEEDLGQRVPADRGPSETRALAAAFNAMLARLSRSAADRERAIEATRRFASDAGHELRTPLTSLRANLDALERNPDLPPAQRRALLEETLAEQERIVHLLDGLQALARGDAGAAGHAPVDLAEVADAALADARRRHPAVDFSFAPDSRELTIEGDENGLRAALDNLLENAARHGARSVRLSITAHGVTVDDDGPGIAPEDRERVFERFARGATTTAPGSGLGLAIVAQQAALHGGTAHAEPSPLGGARLVLNLNAT
jgi:two-component system, OmpR family, sensor histidine kinase PrrB